MMTCMSSRCCIHALPGHLNFFLWSPVGPLTLAFPRGQGSLSSQLMGDGGLLAQASNLLLVSLLAHGSSDLTQTLET